MSAFKTGGFSLRTQLLRSHCDAEMLFHEKDKGYPGWLSCHHRWWHQLDQRSPRDSCAAQRDPYHHADSSFATAMWAGLSIRCLQSWLSCTSRRAARLRIKYALASSRWSHVTHVGRALPKYQGTVHDNMGRTTVVFVVYDSPWLRARRCFVQAPRGCGALHAVWAAAWRVGAVRGERIEPVAVCTT